jgi:hypothetical protein
MLRVCVLFVGPSPEHGARSSQADSRYAPTSRYLTYKSDVHRYANPLSARRVPKKNHLAPELGTSAVESEIERSRNGGNPIANRKACF